MDRTVNFLRSRWWLTLAIAIIAILMLIPTKTGLPGKDYRGCDNTDSRYKSYCLTTQIKSVSQEQNGATSFTAPIKFTEGTEDVKIRLNEDRGLRVGDTVFVNLAEWDKKAYLFINSDSNLLITLLKHLFGASQGATTIIDLNTMTEKSSK